jgi:hypothetical protein
MKNTKRIIASLLAISLSASLAGCEMLDKFLPSDNPGEVQNQGNGETEKVEYTKLSQLYPWLTELSAEDVIRARIMIDSYSNGDGLDRNFYVDDSAKAAELFSAFADLEIGECEENWFIGGNVFYEMIFTTKDGKEYSIYYSFSGDTECDKGKFNIKNLPNIERIEGARFTYTLRGFVKTPAGYETGVIFSSSDPDTAIAEISDFYTMEFVQIFGFEAGETLPEYYVRSGIGKLYIHSESVFSFDRGDGVYVFYELCNGAKFSEIATSID